MRNPGRMLGWLLLLGGAGSAGCGPWSDLISARSFSVRRSYSREEALKVVAESSDHNERARALASLREPKARGGTDQEQEVVLNVLLTSASKDPQAYCRLSAIQALREYKDPRVVKGLEDAYYEASAFPGDVATVIRCQSLSALGQVGHPQAVDLLTKVVKEPPVEGGDQDRQMRMDERQAAARALGRFNHQQATAALVQVLREEKDVALRGCAHDSLQAATGKKLPPDAQAWENALSPGQVQPGNAIVGQPAADGGLRLTGARNGQ